MRMKFILNNSRHTISMPSIPRVAVVLSSLRSAIPAQGRRSREGSSIIILILILKPKLKLKLMRIQMLILITDTDTDTDDSDTDTDNDTETDTNNDNAMVNPPTPPLGGVIGV